MILDRLIFDVVRSIPFVFAVGCVRSEVYVRQHVSDDVVMYVIVKGDLNEFICCGRTTNGIVFCESRQDWFEFFVM